MKQLTVAILAAILLAGCACAEQQTLMIGKFTLHADNTWRIDMPDAYQLYVYDETGSIACNIQYYDYGSLSQSYNELISSFGSNYSIAEMIIASIDTTGNLFSDMEKEYRTYSCGLSAVHYYGKVSADSGNGFYSGTLMLNADCILSTFTISNAGNTDIVDVRNFDDMVISALSMNGISIISQDVSGADAADDTAFPQAIATETVSLGSIIFVTPDGWQLVSSNTEQAIYSVGDASVCLNAYADGSLAADMSSMDSDTLVECLISIVDTAMVYTGIDTSDYQYLPATLLNGDQAVFFEGWGGAVMHDQYLTSVIFYTYNGITGLITILTPEYDPDINASLLADAVNMYYTSDVLTVEGIPNGTDSAAIGLSLLSAIVESATGGTVTVDNESVSSDDDAVASVTITGIDGPVAMVISDTGTSINAEESNALTAAINYTAADAYTYDSLVETLMNDGYSYEAAVFAADNCGAEWDNR